MKITWVYFQWPGTWPFWVGMDTFTQVYLLSHPVLGNTCQTSLYLNQTCRFLPSASQVHVANHEGMCQEIGCKFLETLVSQTCTVEVTKPPLYKRGTFSLCSSDCSHWIKSLTKKNQRKKKNQFSGKGKLRYQRRTLDFSSSHSRHSCSPSCHIPPMKSPSGFCKKPQDCGEPT